MEHYYHNINGWFDFEDIYKNQVDLADNIKPSTFIEVGSWLGKSTTFLGVEIFNSKKPIKFYSIDDFSGSPCEVSVNGYMLTPMLEFIKENSREIAIEKFLSNISPLKEIINPIINSSKDVVNQFENCSVDFVFIDSDHSDACITQEIIQWLPKIKCGGYIGGHDIFFPPVEQAVKKYISKYEITKNSWISQKT